jgi:hypothetical protein
MHTPGTRPSYADAERAERAAIAEIGALCERELDAVKVWTASGCEGVQPRPDAAGRKRLADRLTAAIAAREAAAVLSPLAAQDEASSAPSPSTASNEA